MIYNLLNTMATESVIKGKDTTTNPTKPSIWSPSVKGATIAGAIGLAGGLVYAYYKKAGVSGFALWGGIGLVAGGITGMGIGAFIKPKQEVIKKDDKGGKDGRTDTNTNPTTSDVITTPTTQLSEAEQLWLKISGTSALYGKTLTQEDKAKFLSYYSKLNTTEKKALNEIIMGQASIIEVAKSNNNMASIIPEVASLAMRIGSKYGFNVFKSIQSKAEAEGTSASLV